MVEDRLANRTGKKYFFGLFAGIVMFFPVLLHGQAPSDLNLELWALGSGASTAVGEEQNTYVAGSFSLAERKPASGLVRLDSAGSVDDAFQPDFNGPVFVVHPAPGGGVFVGGDFSTVNNIQSDRMVRLDTEGNVLDVWTAAADGGVFSISSDDAGRLYVTGLFGSMNGEPRSGIARLSAATGQLDDLFAPSFVGTIIDVAVDSLGHIWVGGLFTSVNGEVSANLVVLDEFGEVVETFDTDAPVRSIAYDPDGFVYICGEFSQVNGVPRSSVARFSLASQRNLDAWQPSVNDDVFVCSLDNYGLVIGGDFTTVDGLTTGGAARIADDGEVDLNFSVVVSGNYVTKPGNSGRILSIAVLPDSRLLLGGLFAEVNGHSTSGLVLVAGSSGEVLRTYELERRAEIRSAVTRLDDDSLIIGGQFRRAGEVLAANAIRLFSDGEISDSWPIFADGPIRSLERLNDGSLVIGGFFGSVSGQRHLGLARILDPGSGELDQAWRPELIGTVGVIKQDICDDNLLYVGGFFGVGEEATAEDVVNFAKIRLDGDGSVSAFDVAFDGPVHAIEQLECGQIYVGGSFSLAGGVVRKGLVRVDTTASGSLDLNFNPALNGAVWSLISIPDTGALVIGGEFTTAFGQGRQRLAKLAPSLTSWNPGANGVPVGFAHDGLGGLYAVGTFTRFGGQQRGRIAKISLDEPAVLDPAFNPGADGPVLWSAQIFDDDLIVSGNFTRVGGSTRRAIAGFSVDVKRPDLIFSDRFHLSGAEGSSRGLTREDKCGPVVREWYDPLLSDASSRETPPCVDE